MFRLDLVDLSPDFRLLSVDSANLGESHAQNDSRRGRGVKEGKLGSK